MIYTLTLNPALDLELNIKDFQFNSVTRALGSQIDCGGKGFNVSRMLKNLETDSIAMGFVGGKNGERLSSELKSLNIETNFTHIDGETRINVSIVAEENTDHLKINEAGPDISEQDIERLISQVKSCLSPGDWWVLGGSLPPGVPADFYATLIQLIREAGAFTILDTSGEALRLGCAAKPTLIKPNLDEAMELAKQDVSQEQNYDQWAGDVLALGPENLIVSLGKEGALYANVSQLQKIGSPEIIEQNPIGAGDSLVAGLVWQLSQDSDYQTALRNGIACGAATASKSGTQLGKLHDVQTLLAQLP